MNDVGTEINLEVAIVPSGSIELLASRLSSAGYYPDGCDQEDARDCTAPHSSSSHEVSAVAALIEVFELTRGWIAQR